MPKHEQKVCKNCGCCPECGRPYHVVPYYPVQFYPLPYYQGPRWYTTSGYSQLETEDVGPSVTYTAS